MKISRYFALAALVAIVAGTSLAVPVEAGGRVYVRPSVRLYWGPGWGWWGPSWYSGPQYGYGGYPRVYPNAAYGNLGALDTDISPERAEVWVDGKQVGVADNFDGYPNFLWLEKGTYDVVFYLPGHKTLARQYTIYPGLVIDVEDRMEKGEAIHPTALGPRTHERRDARIRAEREQREAVERRQAEEPAVAWEEQRYEEPEAPAALDARADPGRLLLRVTPDDASIYLDGRFVGTGRELSSLRNGLLVDPGEHQIEVVRPGHQPESRRIDIESGRETAADFDLEPADD